MSNVFHSCAQVQNHLSSLRGDQPHCGHRMREQMRKRLEELNWRTQPFSLNNGNHEEVVGVFNSKPGEVVANPPISLAQQQKKIALKPTEPAAASTRQAFVLELNRSVPCLPLLPIGLGTP